MIQKSHDIWVHRQFMHLDFNPEFLDLIAGQILLGNLFDGDLLLRCQILAIQEFDSILLDFLQLCCLILVFQAFFFIVVLVVYDPVVFVNIEVSRRPLEFEEP